MSVPRSGDTGKTVGRYVLHGRLASGGMASVHFGRLLGEAGFTRVVAIKRLHAQYAADPEFAAMFLDEARLAARIHHPNVVGTLDVVNADDELFLVMEYVPGESLQKLLRAAAQRGGPLPPAHAVAIMTGTLHGLHAAHEARNAAGEWLGIVHRDVSPHNILVGEDGVARLIDFGVAKAIERIHSTRDSGLRGKIAYMAPEQLTLGRLDRRADVYAAAVVLWELLTGRRYVDMASPAAAVKMAVERVPEPPSMLTPGLAPALDEVTLKGLAKEPAERFATALDMATALERALTPSTQGEVARWVSDLVGETLRERRHLLRRIETEPARAPGEPGEPADVITADATWLPGDALQTEVSEAPPPSQPSSVAVETRKWGTTHEEPAPKPRRALVVATSVLGGAVIGAAALFAVLRAPRVRDPSAASTPASQPSASPSPLPSPSPQPSASAEGPVETPAIAVSALPVVSTAKPARQPAPPARAPAAVPAPATASALHRPPLFSRD